MIDEPLISNTHRATQPDAASIRQPFRNLSNASAWHTGAMIHRPVSANTNPVTNPVAAPALVQRHRPVCAMPSPETETLARVLALLETITLQLQELISAQHAASTVAPVDPHRAYTRTQAARLIGMSTWTIDRARKQGLLAEARQIGHRDVRITGESLLKFMKGGEVASVRVRKL